MFDKFRDECGVFGIFGHPEAANLTYLGLYALQHRGQESAGIAASDGTTDPRVEGDGLCQRRLQQRHAGEAAGHIWRSATCATRRPARAGWPTRSRSSSTACTGSWPSATTATWSTPASCATRWCASGAIFQTTTDTEVVVHLFARSREDSAEAAIVDALSQVRGAFSLRDDDEGSADRRRAIRTGSGRWRSAGCGDAWVICSETCAMDLIGATYVRDVEPGEIVVASAHGLQSIKPFAPAPQRAVHLRARLLLAARQLRVRRERQRDAHRVRPAAGARSPACPPTSSCRFPTPASARRSATPRQSGIPMRMGLIRNHYVGRTFIEPQQSIRHFGVRVKLNPGAQHPRGQARGARGRLDRARHDQPQDRADGARAPAHAKCTCASAVRRRSRRASTASTRRSARS